MPVIVPVAAAVRRPQKAARPGGPGSVCGLRPRDGSFHVGRQGQAIVALLAHFTVRESWETGLFVEIIS
jgi:hypothetical protein